jgi:hypothetical protein
VRGRAWAVLVAACFGCVVLAEPGQPVEPLAALPWRLAQLGLAVRLRAARSHSRQARARLPQVQVVR